MVKTLTLSIKDDKGRISKASVNFPDSASIVQVQAWMNEFIYILQPMVKGEISNASLTVNLPINPLHVHPPLVTSDVEERLVMNFRTQGNYRTSVTVATFDDTFTTPLVSTKERIPDFLNEQVEALFNHFTASFANGFTPPSDKRGALIERVDKSRYKHRR